MEALEQIEMDSDPFLQQYRAQRLQEMKEQAKAGNKRSVDTGQSYYTCLGEVLVHNFVVCL